MDKKKQNDSQDNLFLKAGRKLRPLNWIAYAILAGAILIHLFHGKG